MLQPRHGLKKYSKNENLRLTGPMKYLKETEEEMKELSGIELQIASKAKAEGKVQGNVEGKLEVAINLLQLGKSPIELISQATGFSIEFLKELQSTLPTPA